MALNCNHLHASLIAENAALRAFIEVLRDEQTALLKGETGQLGAFVEPQAQWIHELTRLGEQRRQLLQNCGMTPDRAGMDQLLNEHYAGEGEEAEQWEHLVRLATIANQINISNGLLISARMKNTQRALSSLFAAARLPAAYTLDGSTIGYRTAQRIAVA